MKPKNNAKLTTGHIGKTLIMLSLPMLAGMMGLIAFNLVDTYFIGMLGTNELAALTFTFPVVLIINSLAMGLGTGVSAVVSKSIGQGDHTKVQQLTTSSLLLALVLVTVFASVGYFTIDPLFRLLGAKSDIIPMIAEYMTIWYIGIVFVMIPMVGNNALRATGDTKVPAMIMMVATVLNIVFDPILIFGWGPVPAMGIRGAAIATVFARGVTLLVSLHILHHREHMISFINLKMSDILQSWRELLYIGAPTAGARIIMPLATGFVTRLVASYGPEAVAAFGIGTRAEFVVMAIVMALASVLGPFIGQNWGSGDTERVKEAIVTSYKLSIYWGLFSFAVLYLFARPLATVFSENEEVIRISVLFLRIVSVSFVFRGIFMIDNISLNILRRPYHAAFLTVGLMFALYAPLSLIGSSLYGLAGLFGGISAAFLIIGPISYFILRCEMKKLFA